MNRLACVAVVVAITLLASGCTNSHRLSAPLQKRIAAAARERAAALGDASVKTVQVYGPAPYAAIEEASSAGRGVDEPKGRFYLLVLHGHFVCHSCAGVLGGRPPRGTIARFTWSPTTAGYEIFGLGQSLPASITRLGNPTVISLR
jgi:outer membrane murein-binding lipoprotein Lpp